MDGRRRSARGPPAPEVPREEDRTRPERAPFGTPRERFEEPVVEGMSVDGDDVHRPDVSGSGRRAPRGGGANLEPVPILKAEPDLFPPELFELSLEAEPWWVAHLRSRQEKLAAREARARGVPYFLPLREQKVRRRGRTVVSYLPLFPGYLFFRGDPERRMELLRTNLCVRVLEVQDQPAIDEDLGQIRRLQLLGLPLVPNPGITLGDPVRITEGFFRGFLGRVVAEKGRENLVVTVRFLQRAVSVEASREQLVTAPDRDVAAALSVHPFRRRVA